MPRKSLVWLTLAIQFAAFGAAAADAPYLFDVLKGHSAHRKTWDALLASSKPIPAWLAAFSKTYNGVTAPADMVNVEGVAYQAFNVCKPHDCADNSLEIYFTADGSRAYGAISSSESKKIRMLGSPTPAVAAELTKALRN